MTKPVVLCILDGCGMRDEKDGNAFLNAKKPNFDYLWQNYPHSLLTASGTKVGLPEGQMGNSEVGHMNMGAGRIVYQPLELINQKIKDGSFKKNKELIRVMKIVKKRKTNLHIMGLLSDGGVHSHINHLLTIMEMAKELGLDNLYLHLFLDGRDVEPHSSLNYIKLVENKIKELNLGTIATISGRYYAMDRDNNYDRLALAYEAIVNGNGPIFNSPEEMIKKSYDGNVTDEFIKPGIINKMTINDGDGVIGFNFRPDRLRELLTAISVK
jgi:2,3-bisphosphoglycerate-independent phosphoglycerate mutase